MSGKMLSCAECFRQLNDYLDRELSAEEATAVTEHLEQCGHCTGEFAVEREVLAAIRDKLARSNMPPGLMARISARLARE